MPTILELIKSEKQAQDEEESRPAIVAVEASRSFIMDTKPDPSENISLEMCVLRVEEFDKMFRIDLIDRELESDGDSLLKTFDSLDQARRSKFLFQLTIWKNRKSELNRLEYRRGFSYRFEKLLRAEPIPLDGGVGHVVHSPKRYCANSPRFSSDNCTLTTPTREDQSIDADETAVDRANAKVTPVAQVSGKRKVTKDDGGVAAPKKTRKSNPKSLCFDSPEQISSAADRA
ncbi:hypothetical protein PPTG_07290 [Phytophthora nicotianae INRA-310]|uniref:Uncharacterized protein n=1 Tax=Phytophthora nicotianae (strain INRA-310) TaxID=761204 RepID=W2QRF8_PHYN3|nr:hypothetical protein PPTG_07290 [Phytophthora nicotianae INRA-310]ETN15094.1 hypothetical protein PPTG_07290 [Phytophthora nicotianae INRA-310]